MEFTLRQAKKEDAAQMLQVYEGFTKLFIGPATRTLRHFRRMLGKKENINWVAVDKQERVVAYVYGRVDKRMNRGDFQEIVVDPKYDYVEVAKPLVEKVSAVFMDKKVSCVTAGSNRNPWYDKLFSESGFLDFESVDVFMYGILDMQKFLSEMSPIFVNRLKQVNDWKGLVQIECDGHSVFLRRTEKGVETPVWTNEPVKFKVALSRDVLAKLVMGVSDSAELHSSGQLRVEIAESKGKAERLLRVLFPKVGFLILDYW
jgi:hypothetical protein